jgi:hypothetical protein
MYVGGKGAGLATATVATGSAVVLPNTGSNAIITIAVSVFAGMITWGIANALLGGKKHEQAA